MAVMTGSPSRAAPAVGGTPELVIPGDTGFLAPSGDARQLADGLLRVLADGDAARRMGARGRRLIAGAYSLDRLAASHGALYRAVLESAVHSRALLGEQALRP